MILSPFLLSLDVSSNPVKAKSMEKFCKVLPLTQIRYLSLAHIRFSKEVIQMLFTATDNTRADSMLLLKHLNLEETCHSTQ